VPGAQGAGVQPNTNLVAGASKKMLAQNLRKMEADGIVVRKDLSHLVLHIEYDLNERKRPFAIKSSPITFR
jgi:DNA-binding HxlR family transcriptional regulator